MNKNGYLPFCFTSFEQAERSNRGICATLENISLAVTEGVMPWSALGVDGKASPQGWKSERLRCIWKELLIAFWNWSWLNDLGLWRQSIGFVERVTGLGQYDGKLDPCGAYGWMDGESQSQQLRDWKWLWLDMLLKFIFSLLLIVDPADRWLPGYCCPGRPENGDKKLLTTSMSTPGKHMKKLSYEIE